MNTPKAIVFPCYVNGLATIRSLGKRGIPIVAVDSHKNIGFYSKYTHEARIAPAPKISMEGFISFLIENSSKWKGGVLIPTHDEHVIALAKNRKELSKYYIVSVPEWKIAEKAVNKNPTYRAAIAANVPVPKTFFPDSVESLEKYKNEIEYPCILKPLIGYELYHVFSQRIYKINNWKELEAWFKFFNERNYEMMIQEIIPGEPTRLYTYYSYRDLEGNTLAEFTGRKIRQRPPSFGTVLVGESTHTPELMEPSRRLLDEMSYTGLCGIEYKKDPRDKKFKLIEINARSGMWMKLPIQCGVDFPWIMYKDLVDGEKIIVNHYKVGLRWINILEDLGSFIKYRKQVNFRLKDYMNPYIGKKTFAVYDRNDLGAFVGEWLILPYLLRLFLSKQ